MMTVPLIPDQWANAIYPKYDLAYFLIYRMKMSFAKVLFFDTSAAFKPRPSGRGKVRPLSVNPEQAPGFRPGTVEWVDQSFIERFPSRFIKA